MQSFPLFLASREWTCNARSIVQYRQCLKTFGAFVLSKPLVPPTIEAYLAARKAQGLSVATLQNEHRMLKTYCRWLVAETLLEADPFSGAGRVRAPAHKRRRRRTYSDEQISSMLAAPAPVAANKRSDSTRVRWSKDGPLEREHAQSRALVLLLVDSAMRAGEVAALSCGDLYSDELIVHSKGDHEDVAFITAPTRAALLTLCEGRADEAPLFRDWHGRRCTVRALRGLLERLADRAGVELPPRPLHAFRHYAARQWLKAGREDLIIRQFMRHSQLATTQIYTELDASELAELHAASSPIQRLLSQAKGVRSVG
jgi:integrase/recombinase XerC